MTSREQFEVWLRAQPHVLNVGVESDGTYTLHEDRVAWEAWQASRAAVEVQLPDHRDYEETLSDHELGFNTGLEFCAEAIRAAGIKVKGE